MKRKLIDVGLSILFSLTIILTIISLTVLNYRFVMKIIDKKDYINVITYNINKDLKENNMDYNISDEEVREHIKRYVKSRYKYDTKKCNQIINNHILFLGNHNYKKYSCLIYFITLISIIITGNVFLKSKKFHNLANIFIYTFIFLVILYGVIYFKLDSKHFIIDGVVNVINHIILGVGIILFEMGLLQKKRFKLF